MVIDGKAIAEGILEELKKRPKPKKFLAVVMAGENFASESFVRQKRAVARELGVDLRIYRFSESSTQDTLREEVGKIMKHKTCGGVVVQLPLPAHTDRRYVCNAIPPEKDTDVLGERAFKKFMEGTNPVLPPAVGVVEKILTTNNYQLITCRAAIIGHGFLVGKPIAAWLKGKVAELIVIDEGDDLGAVRDADLVISGVGKAGILKPEMLKDGVVVIDFGYSEVMSNEQGVTKRKIVGDFNPSQLTANNQQLKAVSYTPTPGGTGPILVAQLFENFYTIAALQKK